MHKYSPRYSLSCESTHSYPTPPPFFLRCEQAEGTEPQQEQEQKQGQGQEQE